jgi:hypothetical protein
MNAFFVVVLFVLFGGLICFSVGKLIEDIIRELWPHWFTVNIPHDQSAEHSPIPRVKFIPKRPSLTNHFAERKRIKVVQRTIASVITIGLLFFDVPNYQNRHAFGDSILNCNTTQFIDGVRMKFWPVWGRSGNHNIISREKIFGQEIVSKEPAFEAIPEELWPLWARTGNEWLIKHRMPLFRNHT